jgi:hypothetical protein
VSSWPVAIRDSPLRRLMKAMGLGTVDSLLEWKAGALSDGAIALLIQQTSHPDRTRCPANYAVFRLIPVESSVVSFNWDGLAEDCCPQRIVFQPHNRFPRFRAFGPEELVQYLDLLQNAEHLSAQEALNTDVIFPGEEEHPSMYPVLEKIHEVWRTCSSVVVIGFGLGLNGIYDRVWRDVFVDAISINRVPVSIVSPNATEIAGELAELLRRAMNVFAWNYSWAAVSRTLLRIGSIHDALRSPAWRLQYQYDHEQGRPH